MPVWNVSCCFMERVCFLPIFIGYNTIYSGNTSSDKGHKGGLCNAGTRLNHVEQKKNILLVAGRNNPREIQSHLVIKANIM